MTRKIVVVVLADRHLDPFGGLGIAGEQIVDIVGTRLLIGGEIVEHPPGEIHVDAARLGHQRQVGRERPAIGIAGDLFAGERIGPAVGRHALAVFAGGLVGHGEFGGQRAHLIFRIFRATVLGQVAEGYEIEPMAARADFAIDLEAAPKLVLVVGSENSGKAPVLLVGVRIFVRRLHRGAAEGDCCESEHAEDRLFKHHRCPSLPISHWPCPTHFPKCSPAAGRAVQSVPEAGE